MDLRELTDKDKKDYNKLVTHVIQSWEWGDFRESLGLPLLRYGIFQDDKMTRAFQLTLHKIPFTKKYVGYLPKGPAPDQELSDALEIVGKKHNCAFIKIEPDIKITSEDQKAASFKKSPKPLFTKYNFVLDLTPSEDELMAKMHQKTRYNVRLAQKKGVIVEERVDDEGLEIYLNLYFETTGRQNYHGHNRDYHKKVWYKLKEANMARFLIGSYQEAGSSKPEPLTAWMLLNFQDKLYYPYGGSSNKHRDLMHSNLVAWEAIKLGKKLGCSSFDMWGALGPEADAKDPWYGFHRFKQGYGGELVEYIGTFDLVFDPLLYYSFTFVDKLQPLKIFLLKLMGKA